MIPPKYINTLRQYIRKHFSEAEAQAFLFGSSIDPQRKKFFDVDVGLKGTVDDKKLEALKEELQESIFPFIVDIVNFENVTDDFREHVFSGNVQYI